MARALKNVDRRGAASKRAATPQPRGEDKPYMASDGPPPSREARLEEALRAATRLRRAIEQQHSKIRYKFLMVDTDEVEAYDAAILRIKNQA